MENDGQEAVGREAEKNFGNRVRELRLARGLTQEVLAAWMSAAGYAMHQTTLAKIENGGRPTSVGELAALAAVFEVSTAQLVTASDASNDYALLAATASRIAMQEQELADLVEREESLRAQIAAGKDHLADRKRELDAKWGYFSDARMRYEHTDTEEDD